MKNSKFAQCAVVASLFMLVGCASTGNQSRPRFYDPQTRIGCGTIVSIRQVDQNPLESAYTADYRANYRRSDTSDVAALLVGGGVIGMVVGAAGSAAANVAMDASKKDPAVVPGVRWGRKVLALRIALDDGRELNLPMIERRTNLSGNHFKVGLRGPLSYSDNFQNIQMANGSIPPLPGVSGYEEACSVNIAKEKADGVIKAGGNLVDETKIIY